MELKEIKGKKSRESTRTQTKLKELKRKKREKVVVFSKSDIKVIKLDVRSSHVRPPSKEVTTKGKRAILWESWRWGAGGSRWQPPQENRLVRDYDAYRANRWRCLKEIHSRASENVISSRFPFGRAFSCPFCPLWGSL